MKCFKLKTVLLLPFGSLLLLGAGGGVSKDGLTDRLCVVETDDPSSFCQCEDLFGGPASCTPMTYDSCPAEDPATVLDPAVATVSYDGRVPSIAHYVCTTSPTCDLLRPSIFIANGLNFVATFQDPQTVNVYVVPAGATKVTSPDGLHVFPLLNAGAGFADTTKRVTFRYQGTDRTLYLDFQNDCFPTSDGTCQCSTC